MWCGVVFGDVVCGGVVLCLWCAMWWFVVCVWCAVWCCAVGVVVPGLWACGPLRGILWCTFVPSIYDPVFRSSLVPVSPS